MKDILKASLELFSEKGYSNTSTKDIAQVANVAEGTIFKHFGSKENLLYATLIPLLKHTLAEEWEKQLNQLKVNIEQYSFEQFIRTFLTEKMSHANENFKVMKILYTEYLYQGTMRENLATLIPTDAVSEMNGILDYYKRKNQLIDIPNKEIFRLVVGTIMAFVLSKEASQENKEDNHQEAENMIDFIVKGLTPKEAIDKVAH